MEAIVLAGGLGTRLKAITQTLPKPMAPIGSKPFLEFLLDYLIINGVSRIILSVGYKHEKISSYFGNQYKSCELLYSIENEPLGTGGAIKHALSQASLENVWIVNGDTLFDVPLYQMMLFHLEQQSDLTLALKPMVDFDRYGNVILATTKVIGFEEKKHQVSGQINGGIYCLRREIIEELELPSKFSFETEFIEAYLSRIQVHGFTSNGYFIDIGIPEDYRRAQVELESLDFLLI
ncbi:MAG: nucleotidyltransferase family protein [Calothrix sp. MO_167.B12]|nr:nucleotidyltransferase family protein [Calothrix sp. MO_167.B12]